MSYLLPDVTSQQLFVFESTAEEGHYGVDLIDVEALVD
jgi:hypothetical protein